MTGQCVLVCGGRTFVDRSLVYRTLDFLTSHGRLAAVIHGAAAGADTLAADWAALRGVPSVPFPADWKKHGLAAGPMRNLAMLREGKPDLVVAFPGGAGTADMIHQAGLAGVRVEHIQPASTEERDTNG